MPLAFSQWHLSFLFFFFCLFQNFIVWYFTFWISIFYWKAGSPRYTLPEFLTIVFVESHIVHELYKI